MKRVTKNRIATLAVTLILFASSPRASQAAPINQKLARNSSRITFGVDSPAPVLNMQGQVKTFGGSVTLDPESTKLSELSVSVQLDSAQLSPDQMLQAIFLQSVIARLRQRVATFKSATIEHVGGDDYLAHGAYSWHNKSRRATIPFELIRSAPSSTELRVLMRGSLTDATTPQELADTAPGASQSAGWARATLVFTR